jgi:hypothetical protein
LEYYRALVTANSVAVLPMRSPIASDHTAAVLRERYSLGPDDDIPKQMLEVVLCDVCASVLTQMPCRDLARPSKLTSCYGVVTSQNGELVCVDKRNAVKKKMGTKRRKTASTQPADDDEEDEGVDAKVSFAKHPAFC